MLIERLRRSGYSLIQPEASRSGFFRQVFLRVARAAVVLMAR